MGGEDENEDEDEEDSSKRPSAYAKATARQDEIEKLNLHIDDMRLTIYERVGRAMVRTGPKGSARAAWLRVAGPRSRGK